MTDINTFNETAESSAEDIDGDVDGGHAGETAPLGDKKHDHLAEHVDEAESRQEALVDEGLEETFPASDPVSAKRIT